MALVSEYGFNEGVGLHAYDSSGNGRSLTASNATTSWNASGHSGAAGANKHSGVIGANSSLSSFTVMAWIKRTGTWSGYAGLIASSGNNFFFEVSDATGYQPSCYGGTGNAQAAAALTLNTWVHVAVVNTAGSYQMFINGSSSGGAQANGAVNFGTGTFNILGGAGDDGEDAAFVGLIDDVRVFNTALNGAAITTEMGTDVTADAVTMVAQTSGAPANANAFAPTLPSHATGDRLILKLAGKYNDTTIPTINQSWVLLGSGTGGTGSTGNDTGQVFWAVYGKDATSGSETAPTVTPGATGPNSWEWECESWRHGTSASWADSIGTSATWVQSASDTNTASTLTGTAGAFSNQPTAGDAITTLGITPTDTGSALGATTITATGLSGGSVITTSQYVENALGADTAMVYPRWQGFVGTASAGVAMSFTITSSTNHSGSLVAVALRQGVPSPQDITPGSTTVTATGTVSLDMSITPGSTTVTATPGTASLAMSIAPAALTVTATPGTLVLTPPPAAITPAPVTVTATGTLSVAQGIAPAPLTVSVTPGSLNALEQHVTPGTTTVTATPGTLSVAQAIAPTGASVSVTPGSLGALEQHVTPGATTVGVTPGSASVAMAVTPGALTVTATPGTLSLSIGIIPAPLTITANAGTLVVSEEGAADPETPTHSLVVSSAKQPFRPGGQIWVSSLGLADLTQSISLTGATVTATAGTLVVSHAGQEIVPAPLTITATGGSLTVDDGIPDPEFQYPPKIIQSAKDPFRAGGQVWVSLLVPEAPFIPAPLENPKPKIINMQPVPRHLQRPYQHISRVWESTPIGLPNVPVIAGGASLVSAGYVYTHRAPWGDPPPSLLHPYINVVFDCSRPPLPHGRSVIRKGFAIAVPLFYEGTVTGGTATGASIHGGVQTGSGVGGIVQSGYITGGVR